MKAISSISKAVKINMGGVFVDQALPIEGIESVDPFLLIHHWKSSFPGGQHQKEVGVGPHPHRGFSPVTVIYQGAVHHRDSLGNDSVIEKGGVQWMSSGKGVTHSERPSKQIAENGGEFEIIQFWVNTKSKHKMDAPIYTPMNPGDIPNVSTDKKIEIQLISGEYNNMKGVIDTPEDLLIMNVEMEANSAYNFNIPDNYSTLVYALDGGIEVNQEAIGEKTMLHFDMSGNEVNIHALAKTRFLILAGKPLKEKVVSYGPFVLNSTTEILQAIKDAQIGKMGLLIEEF